MVSTNHPLRTSPRRHQFRRHTRTTHAGIQDIIAYFEIRQFQPRRGLLASTLTFCGYTFLHLNMELLLQFQNALQRTLDLVIQDIAIPLPGGRIRQHRERRPRSATKHHVVRRTTATRTKRGVKRPLHGRQHVNPIGNRSTLLLKDRAKRTDYFLHHLLARAVGPRRVCDRE